MTSKHQQGKGLGPLGMSSHETKVIMIHNYGRISESSSDVSLSSEKPRY